MRYRYETWLNAIGLTCLGLLLLLGFIIAANAEGPVARISWVHPTTYIDGTALPASNLKETVVSWGRSAGGPFNAGSVTVTAPATTVDVPGMVCGSYFFVARTTVKTNESSGNSAVVTYATAVSCTTPNPPTAITAQ